LLPGLRDIVISTKLEELILAQFVVRNIESAVKEKLRRRAKENGRSMEEEIRRILRSAVNKSPSGRGRRRAR